MAIELCGPRCVAGIDFPMSGGPPTRSVVIDGGRSTEDWLEAYDEHLAIARLSAANMALKQGDAAGALAEYDVMLRAAATLPVQRSSAVPCC